LETAKRRLEVYKRDTKPVAAYYRDRGMLLEVDGNRSVGEVTEALREAIVTQPDDL
jgi:adenylate kinase